MKKLTSAYCHAPPPTPLSLPNPSPWTLSLGHWRTVLSATCSFCVHTGSWPSLQIYFLDKFILAVSSSPLLQLREHFPWRGQGVSPALRKKKRRSECPSYIHKYFYETLAQKKKHLFCQRGTFWTAIFCHPETASCISFPQILKSNRC